MDKQTLKLTVKMEKRKRQNHSAKCKAKVAIEALKEQKALSELAELYKIDG